MRYPILLSSFFALALSAAAALAQERPAAAVPPDASASMPMDCVSMKRHDHGAERNVPGVKPMPCAPATAASGAKPKTKAHDHAKFHKNQ